MVEIVRLFLSETQLQPPGQRYNTATDTVQTLVEGVWVDTPNADPRTNAFALTPPREGSSARCDAAANMTAKIESIITLYTSSLDIAAFVQGLISIVLIFFPLFGAVVEVIWTLAGILAGLGSVALNSSFTSEVYENITCYFYCELDEQGQITEAGLGRVLDAIYAGENSTVFAACQAIFASLGWVGVNNAGAHGEYTGDCVDCDCPGEWCWNSVPATDLSSAWEAVDSYSTGAAGTYDGTGWAGTNTRVTTSSYSRLVHILQAFPDVVVTSVVMEYEITKAAFVNTGQDLARIYINGAIAANIPNGSVVNGTRELAWSGTLTAHELQLWARSNSSTSASYGGAVKIIRITITGTGINPFGVDNCD